MPKQSKISTPRPSGTNPGNAAPVKDRPEKYYCTRCTRSFTKQKGNFPGSQSPMFRENGGYLPVCRNCVEEMYQHYKAVLGDEKAAIRRICLKFDIYWNEKVYKMLNKTSTTNSRVLSYISKSNLYQFVGKTFDDTLDEEAGLTTVSAVVAHDGDDEPEETPYTVTSDMVEFWGAGFSASYYEELERRFKYWCGDNDRASMDISECAVIRQICILEVTISRDMANGKPIDKSINALNSLLGSANLKPIQKKEDSTSAADATPFGVWIRKIENTRPIAEADPEFEDVDHIVEYISTWFFGHLCKMLKIDNKYSRRYEERMARLRVERPEYEGEDEEAIFEDIFNRASKDEDGDGGYGE